MDSKMKLPIDCIEDIFCHLSGIDLLKSTLVCPEWNNFIGSKRSCMKKIKVTGFTVCWSCRSHNPLKQFLIDSKRKYECLDLSGSAPKDLQEFLVAKGRKWSYIKASLMDFETDGAFLDFLRIFQSSVEKIVFSDMRIKAASYAKNRDLQFPNLKILELSPTCQSFYDKAFVNCKNLERLTIRSSYLQPGFSPPQPSVIRGVKCNHKLKVLHAPSCLLDEDISSEFGIKLTEINIDGVQNEVQHRNLNLFLKTQSGTLENLIVQSHNYVDFEFMKTILSTPRLKKFSLGSHFKDRLGPAVRTLPQNHTITHLILPDGDTVKHILKIFPKVEDLKINEMNDEIAVSMSETCEALKRLSVGKFSVRNALRLATFPQLTEFHCSLVDEGSEESLDFFLTKHNNTLEVLNILECKNNELVKTVLSLPRLLTLTLGKDGIDSLELFAESLPKNHSITDFTSIPCITGAKRIFEALPNVESLTIPFFSDEIADVISESCKNLKNLSVGYFDATKVSNENFYTNLKEFTCEFADERFENSPLYQLYEKLATNPKPTMWKYCKGSV